MSLVLLEFGVILVLEEGKRERTLNKRCHSFRHYKVLQQACWKWDLCETYCLYVVDMFKLITVYAQLQVRYAKTQQYFTNSEPICHCQKVGSFIVFKLCSQCWWYIMLLCFGPVGSKRGIGCSALLRNVPSWSGGWTGNSNLTMDAFFINAGCICVSMNACRYSSVLRRLW